MKDDDLARTIAKLRADYARQLPGSVAQMEELWRRLVAGEAQPPQLAELVRMVHTVAGSGSTFGLPAVTQTARDLESLLDQSAGSGRLPGPAEQETVLTLLAALKQAAAQS